MKRDTQSSTIRTNAGAKWILAGAAIGGALAGLGCGGGGAEQAAELKAAPFTEPALLGSAAQPSVSSAPKMSCTAEMMGPKR
jgi:hypothetical protein